MEVHRRLGVLFNSLPKGQDEIVDGPCGRKNVVAPNKLEDVLAANHLPFSADEQLEQHGLTFGQFAKSLRSFAVCILYLYWMGLTLVSPFTNNLFPIRLLITLY